MDREPRSSAVFKGPLQTPGPTEIEKAQEQAIIFARVVKISNLPQDSFDQINRSYFVAQSVAISKEVADRRAVTTIESSDSEVWAGSLVNSILKGNAALTRQILYGERFIPRSTNDEPIGAIIKKHIDSMGLNEIVKTRLRSTIGDLRELVKRDCPLGSVIRPNETEIKPLEPPPTKEVREIVSPNRYLRFTSTEETEINTVIIRQVDAIITSCNLALCCSSEDAINGYQGALNMGEDYGAIKGTKTSVLMAFADGVGQSYYAQIAASIAIREFSLRGTSDLARNLTMVTEELAKEHPRLKNPDTGIKMLDDVLTEKKNTGGTQTTFNQVMIERATGKVTGLFLGDGGMTILRASGGKEDYPCGLKKSPPRLSSKDGIRGQAINLEDVVGQEIYLESGDQILLYSDGVGPERIEAISTILLNLSPKKEITTERLAEVLKNESPPDDDKTLLIYQRP